MFGTATLATARLPVLGTVASLRLDFPNPAPEAGALLIGIARGAFRFFDGTILVDQLVDARPFVHAPGLQFPFAVPHDRTLCNPGFPLTFQAILTDTALRGTPHGLVFSSAQDWALGASPRGQSGEIVITEILQNPRAVPDADGEWIELWNPGVLPVDIEGWVLRDLGTDYHVIDRGGHGLVVPPGGFLVLARNGDPLRNGGTNAGYVFSNIVLGDDADLVVLERPDGTLVDVVAWDGGPMFPDPDGQSMNLRPTAFDPIANDIGPSWCNGAAPFGRGDRGTPGLPNPSCP
jgi:hypothetical protein